MAATNGETAPPSSRDDTRGANTAPLGEAARDAVRAFASPEGVVTILFTDIVGSTRFRQKLGDESAQERFRQQNQVVRHQIQQSGGFEVKTQGDGFMVAFGDAATALACAIAIQRAVLEDNQQRAGQELHVRMGLNCGQAIKEDEDFFGGPVVVAARIASLAKGGEILVSSTVRGLTGLQPGIHYVRRGRHRLKGLDGEYEVWSVAWQHGKTRRFTTLPTGRGKLAALAVLLAVLVGGGTVTGLLLSGGFGGGGTTAGVAYRDFVVHMETKTSLATIAGDCKATDLVATGLFNGRATGDITGDVTGSFEATLFAADACLRTKERSALTLTDAGRNSLSLLGQSQSVNRTTGLFSGTGTSTQVDRTASVITGGSGRYAGITGKGTCASLAFISQNSPGSAKSTAQTTSDCTFQIALAADAGPVIMQAATGVDTMTVVGHSANLPYEATVTVLYRNDREQPQKGLSLRVPAPQGTQLRMTRSNESPNAAPGERIWDLPDLPAGGVGEFEFAVEVLSSKGTSVSLVPEIDGEGLAEPAQSSPITINVVQ
jgi:class 3 adenylate cyclase